MDWLGTGGGSCAVGTGSRFSGIAGQAVHPCGAAVMIGSGDKCYLMEASRWLMIVSRVKHTDGNAVYPLCQISPLGRSVGLAGVNFLPAGG